MQTLNQDIKNNDFKKVYLLFGEEAFLKKSYKNCLREAITQGDTMNYNYYEGKVISFLYNNPGKDTAADITELRMLSKGNVSQAVESLIQKGLLKRTADQTDRRKIHLSLLPQTADITAAICSMQANLYSQIFCGLSEEDLKFYEQINQQIMENTKKAIKERTTENEFTAKER